MERVQGTVIGQSAMWSIYDTTVVVNLMALLANLCQHDHTNIATATCKVDSQAVALGGCPTQRCSTCELESPGSRHCENGSLKLVCLCIAGLNGGGAGKKLGVNVDVCVSISYLHT